MKYCLIVLLWIIQLPLALAQGKQYEGIVFDKNTKERIAKVAIFNLNSGANNYDNLQAEFKIAAKTGDLLIFSKAGYFSDTVKIATATSIAVYLKPTSIQLKEVSINAAIDPEKQYEAARREYNTVYGSISNRDVLTSGGMAGVGLSIDGIYNLLSFKGRNAARLRTVIERDYHESVIDSRFNRNLVSNVTGLKDFSLTDFMYKYRPGYFFAKQANDYEFIKYIMDCYARYKFNPNAYSLPPLAPYGIKPQGN